MWLFSCFLPFLKMVILELRYSGTGPSICAKGFLDSNFNQGVIDKISNFQEMVPSFTYTQKS